MRERFIEVITYDASHSEKDEPGCLRFDVLEDANDPNRFFFYEVYRDADAVAAHRQTPHFHRFFIHPPPPGRRRALAGRLAPARGRDEAGLDDALREAPAAVQLDAAVDVGQDHRQRQLAVVLLGDQDVGSGLAALADAFDQRYAQDVAVGRARVAGAAGAQQATDPRADFLPPFAAAGRVLDDAVGREVVDVAVEVGRVEVGGVAGDEVDHVEAVLGGKGRRLCHLRSLPSPGAGRGRGRRG